MKKLNLLLIALLLTGIAGCGDEEGEKKEGIPLKYQKCECENEAEFIEHTSVDNILLLDRNKNPQLKPFSISCNFIVGEAIFIQDGFMEIQGNIVISRICNFPFDTYSWNIPDEGILISFEADEYKKCKSSGDVPNYFHRNIILTSLKIQTK
jgi:hypothetical protein